MDTLFNEYLQNLGGASNTLYKYYLYKAVKGDIDLNISLKKLKEKINREWSRKFDKTVKASYFKGSIKLFYFKSMDSMIMIFL